MAWTQKELRITTCQPSAVGSFTQSDNELAIGPPVILANASSASQANPFPTVVKPAAGATTLIYGAFSNYQDNGETNTTGAVGNRRVGVVTGGIVPFAIPAADTAAAVADVGKGIVPGATAGGVNVSGTALAGRGAIVAVADAGRTVYVDLDVDPLA